MKIHTFLLILLLLGGISLSAQTLSSVQNLTFRAITDSTSGKYNVQLSFVVPQPKGVSEIQLQINRASTGQLIRQVKIPANRKQGRRNGVGLIRKGNKIWLDLGARNGYDFEVKVRLKGDNGTLSGVKTKTCQVI